MLGSRRWVWFPLWCSLSIAAGVGVAAPAAAQTAESQAAEALFRQAKALMEKGDLEPACEKFAASQALEPGLGTLLYLGDCYERAGRFASALATFREAVRMGQDRDDETRLRLAQVRVSALEPRVPKLEIRNGASSIDELQVTVAGVPVGKEDFGRPIERDAGTYEIRFSAPGYESFVSHVELKNAGSVAVNVPRLVPVQGAAPARARDVQDEPAGSTQRTLAWVVGGAGAALLATAGVFTYLAASKNGDSKDNCAAADENSCGPEGVKQRDDAKSLANVATALTVLGGASLATGVVLFVAAPDTEDPVGQAAVVGVRGVF